MSRTPSPIRAQASIWGDSNAELKIIVDRVSPIGQTERQPRRRIAFGWYGGKFSHLDWLLPHLPECHHYCEPFSGSAAVLLNKPLARRRHTMTLMAKL